MLTAEENRTLTEAGPGTPMGNLLRRYWHPVAAVKELDDNPTKRIRLLSEDLALYRDLSGTYGLVDLRCGHRHSFLSEGMVEDCGIRCYRHGWLYDETGQCLDQPLEEKPFAGEVRIKAYKVATKAGLVWAYLGPEPSPLVPDWEPFTWEDGLVQIVFTLLPCNWFQCQENSIDPADLEWLHEGINDSLDQQDERGPPPPLPPEVEMDFDEFEYGFIYRRAPREDAIDAEDWTVGRTSIWPNGVFSGTKQSCHFEWNVPMDDTHTLNVAWFIDRPAPGNSPLPEEQRYQHWYAPTTDEKTGRWLTSHLLNRKFVIWLNQGTVVDRTKEHLMESDKGLVMMRTKVFAQVDLVADGGEPKATIRDPRVNRALSLPMTGQRLTDRSIEPDDGGRTPISSEDGFPYVAGQPPEAEALYRQVIASWQTAGTD
ncbi:MAG: Rieske 2Fe-2S domain-containing protein [Dehalococcoidia bacterium]|nr:Rieske 2Fe-2S domain-containing protein [Dehalococcoidia bacterium]